MSDSTANNVEQVVEEARRQVSICNACRYCEGFCAVFPAIDCQRPLRTSGSLAGNIIPLLAF